MLWCVRYSVIRRGKTYRRGHVTTEADDADTATIKACDVLCAKGYGLSARITSVKPSRKLINLRAEINHPTHEASRLWRDEAKA